jgi:hypothetical protein
MICRCGVEIEGVLDTPPSAGKFYQRIGTSEVCVDNHWHEPAIDVYEVENKSGEFDVTVFRHDQSESLLEAIWLALDGLEDGETLTITYRKYSQAQMDDVYEEV